MTTDELMTGFVFRQEYDHLHRELKAAPREMHRARKDGRPAKWVWMQSHLRARVCTSGMKVLKTQLTTRRIQAAA